MRLTRLVPATALVAAGLYAGGCKKETTAPSVSLSQSEVGQLMTDLGTVMGLFNFGFIREGVAGHGSLIFLAPRAGFSVAGPINGSVNCPSGGTARAAGSSSGTTTLTFDVTYTFSGCMTTNYTIGGSFRRNGSYTASPYSDSETVTGTLSVNASGGRSGNCTMNFTWNGNNVTSTATGTICGVSASTIL
jgi:hypothetical protein